MIGKSSHSRPSLRHHALRRTPRRSHSATPDAMPERLAALESAVLELAQAQADHLTALNETADRIDKQVTRASKEQFKANTLAESQHKNVETMLEQLHKAATYRERELTQMRERLAGANAEGRLEVIRRLFPAIDGLEEALQSGQRQLRAAADVDSHPPLSFWQRLSPTQKVANPAASSSQAITAWLDGLALVQERLLEALASADVLPIPTEGRAFDPHLHVAVETVPTTAQTAPGFIAREHRRGYVHNDTVLRYAEVVVARGNMETSL